MRCTRFKKVKVRGRGIQRRCAKFGKGRAKSAGKSRGYKRRPARKGKRCKLKGVNKRGFLTCRSYGGKKRGRKARAAGSNIMPFTPSATGPKTGSGWLKLVGLGGLTGSGRKRKRRRRR